MQTTSRALKERVSVDAKGAPEPREWGAYPILSFREVPVIEVVSMPRPGEAPLDAGESSSVPGTAAIANAIFDAGVRFRQPPFTPEVVREALGVAPPRRPVAIAQPTPERRPVDAPKKRRRWWGDAGALAAGLAGMAGSMVGHRPVIAPVDPPDPAPFTAAALERGRQVAAAGDCVVCHTTPGGEPNAGGRAMETPFGTIVTANLTPDPDTGIGPWSFAAFERAMREGISRDGRGVTVAESY